MNSTDILGRRLQIFNGDDFIMLPDLGPLDGPSRITMCTSSAGVLTGFQVFYGTYNEKAGSAHGDLSTNCVNHKINDELREISFFGATSGTPYLEGMSIVMQPFKDGTYPGPTISAGRVSQIGQKKRTVQFPATGPTGTATPFLFFGFKTLSNGNVINNVSVITYDKDALFNSKFNETNLVSAKQQVQAYAEAKKSVVGILSNRALMQLKKAEPKNFGGEPIRGARANAHLNETEERSNEGVIIVISVGAVVCLVSFIIVCLDCKQKENSGSTPNGRVISVGDRAATTSGAIQTNTSTTNLRRQSKLDDIF